MQGVKSVTKQAFMKSIPIMCSYIFVSMAYGMMMENAGFAWYYSLLTSLTVYTGVFQFVLITFLSSGASIVTIAVTALLMNSRQSFYSLSFLEAFRKIGRKKLYMIHTMTDETYAVNCTIEDKDENSRKEMFLVAFFSRCYWMFGAVMGGLIGQLIPFGLRSLPFLVFQEGKELPDQIKRLGMVLPSSIMAVLIVYCLKDVGDDFMADGLWKLIAAAITAVSYRWKHNTLISILLGTVSYMMFLHFFG